MSKATAALFLNHLKKVNRKLTPALSTSLKHSMTQASEYGAEVEAMVGAVQSLCERGGKRLRPGLCVSGALAVDEKADWQPLIQAGVALELLQAYFLIHDDWMDDDDERRGGPTAHIQLAKAFRSKKIGACSAILAGDHAVALAQAELAELKVSPSRLVKAYRSFAWMQLMAVAGQQLDVKGTTKYPELTYELKTASYTVQGPLRLGAELAGAKTSTLDALSAYGLPAGIGFQLRDDLIGVFGDPEKTGKIRGNDLRSGKNTSLLRLAKKRLKGRELASLKKVVGNLKAGEKSVEKAIGLLETCGAKAEVEARIEELLQEALHALDTKAITPLARKQLASAATALCHRSY